MSAVDYQQSDPSVPSAPDQTTTHEREERLSPLEYAARVYNRAVIIFVLYVLSIGPTFWLWVESMYLEGNPAIARFYYPLLLLCKWIPPFGDLVNWYVRLWFE